VSTPYSQRFRERFVGTATPGALAVIRIVTCSVALLNLSWENLPSAARIPLELRRHMGLLELFYDLPLGFERLVTSSAGLFALEGVTVLALALALAGFQTRISLPVAALGHFLCGGILRQYAWFFHTGLIPFYLLTTLCFTPCADGWSVDAWRRKRRGQASADPNLATATYGWARYACWLVVALPYVFAGMSKLRAGPPVWWVAENFKRAVLGSNLEPMHFDFDLGLRILDWPGWVWSLMGFTAVATELGYGAVLFSRRARRVVPVMTACLHVGVLFFQNILFFDLILLQLIFYDFDARLRRSRPIESAPFSARSLLLDRRAAALLGALTLFLSGWWIGKKEYYPLTAMQMFAGRVNRSTTVNYQLIFARRQSGEVFEARLEDALPVLHDTRYREALDVFGKRKKKRKAQTRKLLDVAAAEWNRGAAPGTAIVEFEIQDRVWNFAKAPDDPEHGTIAARFVHAVRSR